MGPHSPGFRHCELFPILASRCIRFPSQAMIQCLHQIREKHKERVDDETHMDSIVAFGESVLHEWNGILGPVDTFGTAPRGSANRETRTR